MRRSPVPRPTQFARDPRSALAAAAPAFASAFGVTSYAATVTAYSSSSGGGGGGSGSKLSTGAIIGIVVGVVAFVLVVVGVVAAVVVAQRRALQRGQVAVHPEDLDRMEGGGAKPQPAAA